MEGSIYCLLMHREGNNLLPGGPYPYYGNGVGMFRIESPAPGR